MWTERRTKTITQITEIAERNAVWTTNVRPSLTPNENSPLDTVESRENLDMVAKNSGTGV
jgi:hypothetical protein